MNESGRYCSCAYCRHGRIECGIPEEVLRAEILEQARRLAQPRPTLAQAILRLLGR